MIMMMMMIMMNQVKKCLIVKSAECLRDDSSACASIVACVARC